MSIMSELTLKTVSYSQRDHDNPFISYLLAFAATGQKTLSLATFRDISILKFIIRSYICLEVSNTSTARKVNVELQNQTLWNRYIQYVQDEPPLNQTPYSTLVNFSGLLNNISRQVEGLQQDRVSLLDLSTLRVRIKQSQFDLAQVKAFFKDAIQQGQALLKKLLLGFKPTVDFKDLIEMIGSETKQNNQVGHSFWDLFPDYKTVKQPVFAKWLLENKPQYFLNKAKQQQWLVECEQLLNILLVLIHTTGRFY